MFFKKQGIQFLIGTGILLLCCFITGAPAVATPIASDVLATGVIGLDTGFIVGDNNSGKFGIIQGGAATESNYDGSGVTGGGADSIPTAPNFTDLNDGFAFSGAADVTYVDDALNVFETGIDFALMLSNTSASDTYKVEVRVETSNLIGASGPDAYTDSIFFIENSAITELFFSDFISDTLFGNSENGMNTGGFGGTIGEDRNAILEIILPPGGSEILFGAWTLEGGVFESGSMADAVFTAMVTIESVTNMTNPNPKPIPEPGTFLLLGLGMLGIAGFSRLRKQ